MNSAETIKADAAAVKGRPDKAVAYLFSLPVNRITLTAIIPEGGPTTTATFLKTTDSRMKAIKWITEQQAERKNIYFQDCSVGNSINKRPVKDDVTLIHCAHADIDVQGNLNREEHAAAMEAIITKIDDYQPAPTDVIRTGNGFQCYWYLDAPLVGSKENVKKVEAVNKALAAALDGDRKCFDVAHLLRVPFTVNYPNKNKRALGRVPVLATIWGEAHNDDIMWWRLDQLPSAPVESAAPTSAAPTTDSKTYAGIGSPEIPDIVDLSRLSPDLRETIKKGSTAADQSDAVYAVGVTMRRFKYSDGEIIATITDPDNGISAHILRQTQRTPVEQASRIIGDMNAKGVAIPEFKADPVPETDAEMKDRLKRTEERRTRKEQQAEPENWDSLQGGWCFIGQQKRYVRKRDGMMWETGAFSDYFANVDFPDKGTNTTPHKWIMNRKQGEFQKFDTFCYLPGEGENVNGSYNQYVPSRIVATAGDTKLWDEHLIYLFPNELVRKVVLDWLAWVIQNLEKKPKHALFILGQTQGTGKSWIGDVFAELVGTSNHSPVDQGTFESPHNGWQMRTKLITCEEVRSLSPAARRKLHGWITQGKLQINEKNMPHVNIPDVMAYLFFSNKLDAIELDDTDRRYAVAETNVKPKSKAYYCTLYDLLDDPAALAAIKYQLMNRPLADYTAAGSAPQTDAKLAMIEEGATDLQTWMVSQQSKPPFSYSVVTLNEIVEIIPRQYHPRGGKLYPAVKDVLRRRYGGIPLGDNPIQTGPGRNDRNRAWVIGPYAAANAKLSWSQLGAIYRAEHKVVEAKAETDAKADFEE